MKAIGDEIDRKWGDLLASIPSAMVTPLVTLTEAMENLDMARAKCEDKSEGQLEQIIEKKERKSRDLFIRKYGRTPEEFDLEQQIFNEVIYLERANPLDVLTAEHLIRIDKLLALHSEVETRKTLID
jgi:tRNA splicing endonuclease